MAAYNVRSEKSLVELYSTLQTATNLEGYYRAEISGPKFLIPIKHMILSLLGLPGWKGKHFYGDYALNVLERKGKVTKGLRMSIKTLPHRLDSKPGLVTVYEDDASFIWRRCTDEFRVIDEHTLLGMTFFDLPFFRGKPSMFLLHKCPDEEGINER